MKKTGIIFVCLILCAVAVFMGIYLNGNESSSEEPTAPQTEAPAPDNQLDKLLKSHLEESLPYKQEDFVQFVLENISFDSISCIETNEIYEVSSSEFWVERYEAMFSPLKVFDVKEPLQDAATCRKYMEVLWHEIAQMDEYIACVPFDIICYTEQNEVLFRFVPFTWRYYEQEPVLEVLVSVQTGEYLLAHNPRSPYEVSPDSFDDGDFFRKAE